MLATLSERPPRAAGWVYEPKYDGIRAIAELAPSGAVKLWSRRGNDKTAQFPEIAASLTKVASTIDKPIVLDGEIVALDPRGRPMGFQNLQGRIHLAEARDIERAAKQQPTAYVAFDILCDAGEDVRGLPLSDRRKRIEHLFGDLREPRLRLSEQVSDDGTALQARAANEGWEGLIAKDARSVYQSGRRSSAWLKLKRLKRQEFVVGGWTEPRQTRAYFGALLLGLYDGQQRLQYVGHTGTGFDTKELARVSALLKRLETRESPFASKIRTNEPAHWVRPELVAEVKFTEWTSDAKLRHPVYLGLRDDKPAKEVGREVGTDSSGSTGSKGSSGSKSSSRSKGSRPPNSPTGSRGPAGPDRSTGSARSSGSKRPTGSESSTRPGGSNESRAARARPPGTSNRSNQSNLLNSSHLSNLVDQLHALEDSRRDGIVDLPDGDRVGVTNLAKVFWPQGTITKGELLRYYAAVSPYLLPVVEDRPLVMKRFPNGVDGSAFYQQQSRAEKPPRGVRLEVLPDELDPIGEAGARRFVGGSLTTLLYMTQIAAISQDPWFSRVQSPLDADYVALDLDPTEEATFARVLDVARWVRDELERARIPGYPKTSGASGLHIYIPLPAGTSYESGLLLCQLVATVVAARHPKAATVERTVRARPAGTVYVDYLQNILGKTLATAYSARASAFAGVSTPLEWQEIDERIDPRDYTVRTAPVRFRDKGDVWQGLRTGRPVDLRAVLKRYGG